MTGQAVAPDSTLLLEVDGLRVNLAKRGRQRRIVTDAAFRVAPGEAVAIVGESGSGKSVTARAVMGLLADGLHAEGAIHYRGSDLSRMKRSQRAAMCGRDMTMILQDPFTMLNPTRRCGEQVLDGVRDPDGGKLSKRGRLAEARRRLAEVGIADPAVAERYPFELSGGMRQRVGARRRARGKTRNCSSPTSRRPRSTSPPRRRSCALIKSLQESRGMGLILITHDLRVAFSSAIGSTFSTPAASRGERRSASSSSPPPSLHRRPAARRAAGRPPRAPAPRCRRVGARSQTRSSGSCAFAARCSWAEERCRSERPALVDAGGGHLVACRRIPDIGPELQRGR